MHRKAFTLVELLVVVAIISLLVILFLPNLTAIKSVARASLCRNNLHQLQAACLAYEGREVRENRIATRYPPADYWPSPAPMLAVADAGLYICPEDNASSGSATVAGSWSSTDTNAPSDPPPVVPTSFQSQLAQLHFHTQPGLDVPFDSRNYDCHVKDYSDRTEYWFEDLGMNGDNWSDAAFAITKAAPRKLVWMPQAACGYRNQLMMGSVVLMQDCRHWTQGDLLNLANDKANTDPNDPNPNPDPGNTTYAFTLAGGATNYGINFKVGGAAVKSGTVVLLDYLYLKANDTEDMTTSLKDPRSARHRGRMNVLLADGAVLLMSPSQLDPAYPDTADLWDPR
jgi:prepilin-type N-terminal cleavage/methylation domain-containing protein/prepilin-type processing-associated H-X9-DG protein